MSENNDPEQAALLRDRLVNDAIDCLRTTLAGADRQGLRVLVDPALHDPVRPLLEKHDLPVTRLTLPYGDVSADLQPYLVSVDDEQTRERFVNATIDIAVQESQAARDAWPAARAVCAWLVVDDAEIDALVQGFKANAVVAVPGNASQRRLLRFWDPRVLPQLARILDKDAWRHWLPVNATWLSIDGWGQMTRTEFARPPATPRDGPRLDGEPWRALERIADVNHSMVMGSLWHRPPDARVYAHLDRLLAHAAELGCTQALDRVTYAVLADAMRLPLEQHPDIAAMLARTRRENVSFSDLLSLLDPSDWERIGADLRRHAGSSTSSLLAQESS